VVGEAVVNLPHLRSVAKAATPGPWRGEELLISTEDPQRVICEEDIVVEAVVMEANDMAYIATFSPSVVLALLDRLSKLEAVAEAAQPVFARYFLDGSKEFDGPLEALGSALSAMEKEA
jgi:hypothetical protein